LQTLSSVFKKWIIDVTKNRIKYVKYIYVILVDQREEAGKIKRVKRPGEKAREDNFIVILFDQNLSLL
jgi:hypothetical protein